MNYKAVYRTAPATLGLLTTWTRTENNRNYAPGNQGFSSIIPSQQFYDGQYVPRTRQPGRSSLWQVNNR